MISNDHIRNVTGVVDDWVLKVIWQGTRLRTTAPLKQVQWMYWELTRQSIIRETTCVLSNFPERMQVENDTVTFNSVIV